MIGNQDVNGGTGEIEVNLPPTVTARRLRQELIAFARFCAVRIARELGAFAWSVSIEPAFEGGYGAAVRACKRGCVLEARATSSDPVFAIWNAMCRIEQPLRELGRTHPRVTCVA